MRLFWYLSAVVVAFAMEAEPATCPRRFRRADWSPPAPRPKLSAIASIDRAGAWRWIAEDDSRIDDSSPHRFPPTASRLRFAAPPYECGEPVHERGRGPDLLDLVTIESSTRLQPSRSAPLFGGYARSLPMYGIRHLRRVKAQRSCCPAT
jgi:hypothetical protein